MQQAHEAVSSMSALPTDLKDHPVILGAIASGCSVLVSTDAGSFGHGHRYGDIVCWHPDTFLTEYFKMDRDLYELVVEECRELTPSINLLP